VPQNPQAVIYEVNLSIDVEVIDRFDEWLNQHTEEMLAIPGFISATTSVPDVEKEFRKHRCVRYRLSDQSALDDYLETEAEKMRAKAEQAFEGKFTAERRVLSIAEASLAKGSNCANCGAVLTGRFCSVCGQREEPRVPTIWSVLGEFTNEVFGVESKFWRSFRHLIFKPGQLTLTFLLGRRQLYMSPLRLYLLLSIATFTYFAVLNSQGLLDASIDVQNNDQIISEAEADAKVAEVASDLAWNDVVTSGFLSEELDEEFEEKARSAIAAVQKDIESGNTQAVFSRFIAPLPTALLLFLPFIALLFKLLYLGSGKYYVEHLVYVLHNHAFLFAVLIFTTSASQVTLHWPRLEQFVAQGFWLGLVLYLYRPLRGFLIAKFSISQLKAIIYFLVITALFVAIYQWILSEGISVIIGLVFSAYVPYYVYKSMRVVYKRPAWATIPTVVVISMMYLALLILMLMGSAIFVGFTYR